MLSHRFSSLGLTLSGLFFVACAARLVWLTVGPYAWGPRIAVDGAPLDLGAASTDEEVRHEFLLRNIGRAVLRVNRVAPGCSGCVEILEAPRTIQPGATAALRVKVSLKSLRGPFHKAVVLHTNDPTQPELLLRMHGTAIPDIEVDPPMIEFVDRSADKEESVAVVLRSRTREFSVLRIAPGTNALRVEQQVLEARRSYRLRVTKSGVLAPQRAEHPIVILTDHPGDPRVVIPAVLVAVNRE